MNRDIACLDAFSRFEAPEQSAQSSLPHIAAGTEVALEAAGSVAFVGLSLLAAGGVIEVGGRLVTGRFNRTGAVVGALGAASLAYGFRLIGNWPV